MVRGSPVHTEDAIRRNRPINNAAPGTVNRQITVAIPAWVSI
jgi:hypothetical protein